MKFPFSLPLLLDGATAGIIIDGLSPLYTKSAAAELALAANLAGCAFVRELSVRRIHIAHRRCKQGFQGAQHPWHTTLVQSLVCYTFPEVYTFLKCKKPHTQHLDGADMGLDASLA